ncbi:ABC transporter permease [Paenibacillus mendelii]|uniref:Transport permease protein n=1 Tax=Paenibacillus mendelii TaxID=206163 RepID=A0ABV6JC66_9BACL|nr:ABC transporter permease [Paenibacillus mendelii]MCQ6561496.1 ABC transporter permease [Paenibacillus mendelii]
MKAYLQLTVSQLKLFARNRQMLVFTLFFPVFFMLMFGFLFNNDGPMSLDASIIDQDRTEASQELASRFGQTGVLNIKTSDTEAAALDALKHNDLGLVVVIPEGYGDSLSKFAQVSEPSSGGTNGGSAAVNAGTPAQIRMIYDSSNLTTAGMAKAAVNAVTDGVSKELVHFTPAVTVAEESVQSQQLSYIDFLVPGIVAMMIMSNNLNGVAGQIASWRERGVLRRMQSTMLRPSSFIAAQITARLALNGVQAVIVLLIGQFIFGTQVRGSWGTLLFFVIIGTLAFMSIGFIVASLARTPESANPIAAFLSFPMMFLGGVFFPIKNMPEFVQKIVNLLPIAHLSTAMREVMNTGAGFASLWTQTLVLGGWMIVAFAIASYTFKWE